MPRGSQRLTRGAWRSQTRVTEAAWRRPKLPRGCLGRLWDLPGRPPGAILEQNFIPNSMIVQQSFLEVLKLSFMLLCFARPCRYTVIYNGICMFSGLDLFRKASKIYIEQTWKINPNFINNLKHTPKMHNKLQENHPKVNFEASKGQEKQ